MEIFLTPWKLIVFLLSFGVFSLVIWLLIKKHFRTALVIVFIAFLFIAFKPFRLGVDPAPIYRTEQATAERHSKLPERVEVESKSFDEYLEKSSNRIEHDNKAVKNEILGE